MMIIMTRRRIRGFFSVSFSCSF